MHRPLGRDRGVTLIELVVAVAILALGTAAAWRSLDAARRGVGAQADRALAQEVALNRAAELRLPNYQRADRPAPLPGVERLGGIDWTLTQTTLQTEGGLAETTLTVSATGRPGARLVIWLPAPDAAP